MRGGRWVCMGNMKNWASLIGLVLAACSHVSARESMEEAAVLVKQLVYEQTTGTMSSIFPADSTHPGHPFALMEYHAPCHPTPALTMLLVPISLGTRNIVHTEGHNATYTIAKPGPAAGEGRTEDSPMRRGRVAFIGHVTFLPYETLNRTEVRRLEECYASFHPDARMWFPYKDRHPFNSIWAKFEPEDIYYVGGFGNEHYIGHIPVDVYAQAGEKDSQRMDTEMEQRVLSI